MPYTITHLPSGEVVTANTGKGTEYLDFIYGTDPKTVETLRGYDESDQLFGGQGKDRLFGGANADHLYGGPGRDILHGGRGPDVFYFEYPSDGKDNIKDFTPGEDFIFLGESIGFRLGMDAIRTPGHKVTYDYDGPGGLKPVVVLKANVAIEDDDIVFF